MAGVSAPAAPAATAPAAAPPAPVAPAPAPAREPAAGPPPEVVRTPAAAVAPPLEALRGSASAALARGLQGVSAERLKDDLAALVGFGTRHTLSDQADDRRGIGAAARWLRERFEGTAQGRVAVIMHTFTQPPTVRVPREVTMTNVLAVLPSAAMRAAGRAVASLDDLAGEPQVWVLGHYDSRATDPLDATSDAPGANDNGSGTVALLEIARALGGLDLDATVVLAATVGEEQGLLGAARLASDAARLGLPIVGVLNMDIVGDPTGHIGPDGVRVRDEGRVRVFSQGLTRRLTIEQVSAIRDTAAESDSPSRQLARFVRSIGPQAAALGSVEPLLIFRADRYLRGGDHLPFGDEGFPAVRFVNVPERYERQHQDVRQGPDGQSIGDLPQYVDYQYLARVVRLVAASAVALAQSPRPPRRVVMLTRQLANDTTLRWEPSPSPDVAGYEVVYRATTEHDWTAAFDVGNTATARVPVSKDDFQIGVRAYDAEGNRGPVTFATAGR
ncbi:MAG: aminopeptidase [Planctomyces sp.]|nr:aminopeptidase [Planctomyces sp.]